LSKTVPSQPFPVSLCYVDEATIDLSRARFWLASQGALGNRALVVVMWRRVLLPVLSRPFGSQQDRRQPFWLRCVTKEGFNNIKFPILLYIVVFIILYIIPFIYYIDGAYWIGIDRC